MGSRAATATAIGFGGGVALGLIVWTQQTHRYRRNLFSGHPWRRAAALGYLRGRCTAQNVRLLRDYVEWERHAALQRRGRRLLRQMERSLQ